MTQSELALLASFGPLDLLAAALCVIAALLALSCAREPMYHSSRRRRRHERRFWSVVVICMLTATAYQILGAQVPVRRFGSRFLEMVADHGMPIEQGFYAALGVLLMLMIAFFYAAVGASIKRNALASAGLLTIAVSAIVGVWAVGADARRLAAGDPALGLGSMQVGGFMVGALLVLVAAFTYRRKRASQNQWRSQLRDPRRGHVNGGRGNRRRSDQPTHSRPIS